MTMTEKEVLQEILYAGEKSGEYAIAQLILANTKAILLLNQTVAQGLSVAEEAAGLALVDEEHACPNCGERKVDCLENVNVDAIAYRFNHRKGSIKEEREAIYEWEGIYCVTCEKIYLLEHSNVVQ